jgi:hypothetical protein
MNVNMVCLEGFRHLKENKNIDHRISQLVIILNDISKISWRKSDCIGNPSEKSIKPTYTIDTLIFYGY